MASAYYKKSRDHLSSVVRSGEGRIEHCDDAMQAEALAALEALTHVSEFRMTQVELEMDAINLREALIS